MKRFIAVFTICLSLSSCQQVQNTTGATKQDMGTVIGGVGGAILGAQIGKGNGQLAATAAGALLGAYLGSTVGASLDKTDLAYYDTASQTALQNNRIGQTGTWNNPDSGNSGTVTPTKTFKTANGNYCREYTQTIKIAEKTERGYGTACRQPDGTWRIIQ